MCKHVVKGYRYKAIISACFLSRTNLFATIDSSSIIENRQIVSDKKSFVLRIDEETYKAVEKWAADEFRSVNGQLEYIIDKALKESGRRKTTDKPPKK